MLEYLEDIIGSNKYVGAIEEANAKVEEMQQERMLHFKKVTASEKSRDDLEGAKAEAEEYLKKERELTKANAIQAQLFRAKTIADQEKIVKQQEELKKKMDKEQEKLEEKTKLVGELEANFKRESEKHDKISKEVSKCSKEWATFERKDIKFREDLKFSKQRMKKSKRAAKAAAKRIVKHTNDKEQATDELPKLEKQAEKTAAKIENENEKLEKIYESIKGTTASLRPELAKRQKALKGQHKQLSTLESERNTKQTELQLLVEGQETNAANIKATTEQLESLNDRRKSLIAERKATVKEMKNLNNSKATLERDIAEGEQREQTLSQEQYKLQQSVETVRMALRQDQGRQQKALMDACRRGGPLEHSGLYGRLGDLGAIDNKYDVAITTACGALNHQVVQTTKQAQQCVEFLRVNGLGRATFIILDKIQYLAKYMNRNVHLPHGVQRLFDLVKVKNPALKIAFYFGLRNTLVAQNLDQATKIAYKNGKAMWRVVTLNGALIDTSGTMSGGGKQVRKGGMKAVVVDKEARHRLTKSETKLKDLEIGLAETRNQMQTQRTELREVEKKLHALSLKEDKLTIDIEALPNLEKDLRARLAELKSAPTATAQQKSQQKKLKKEVHRLNTLLAAAKREVDSQEEAIAKLKDEIMNAGGDALKKQKAKVSQLEKALKKTKSDISKAKLVLRTCDKKIATAEKDQKQAESDTEEATKVVTAIRKEIERMDKDAKLLIKRRDAATAELEEKEQLLDELKEEFSKIREEASKIELVLVDIENQQEEYAKGVEKHERALKHWNKQLDELKEQYKANLIATNVGQPSQPSESQLENADTQPDEDNEDEQEEEEETSSLPDPELVLLTEDELATHTLEDVQYKITMLEEQRNKLKNKVNMSAIEEYWAKHKELQEHLATLDEITAKRDQLRDEHDALRKQRLDMFSKGFFTIKMKLKEMYRMLTLGGDAELEQVDSLDPFSEGILYSVRPPRKSWKCISNLSGGEKTLCSLALVFALHHFRPTPLYVMDEIDAALDFKNVSIIANYIKDRTKDAQFVVISLRNNMFELADRLVGIYKTNNATKSVTINPKELKKALGDRTNRTNNTTVKA